VRSPCAGERVLRARPKEAVPVRGPPPLSASRTRVRLLRVGCLLLRARAVARRELRHRVEQLFVLQPKTPTITIAHGPSPRAYEGHARSRQDSGRSPTTGGAAPHRRRGGGIRRNSTRNASCCDSEMIEHLGWPGSRTLTLTPSCRKPELLAPRTRTASRTSSTSTTRRPARLRRPAVGSGRET